MTSERDRSFARAMRVLVAVGAIVGVIGIGWGIPNGNRTWAADSVAPMTPAAVAYNVFVRGGFDSGYFYFKYPVGHQLLLAAATAPVIGLAVAGGSLSHLKTDYPYGLDRPEGWLAAMLIALRLVSVAMAIGLIILVAAIARRLADAIGEDGNLAGILAACTAAASYPLVFYAHTSNVEVPYLFWAFAALYAMLRGVQQQSARWLVAMGIAAAMAVSTKEQIAGFLVPLPLVLLALHWRYQEIGSPARWLPPGAVVGGLLSLATYFVVNAGFYNPSGLRHRIQFLTHTLDPAVREAWAPYEFPIDFSTEWTMADEWLHLGKTASGIITSIGWPWAVVGAAAMLWLVRRAGLRSLVLWGPLLGYYMVSLRALKQVEIRYTMAMSTLLALAAGIALAALWQRWRPARALVLAGVVAGLLYSLEVLAMLTGDPRYQAEHWLAANVGHEQAVEIYQSLTYLPRFGGGIRVHEPAFDEISERAVRERAPDFLVLSDKGREGIYMYPNPDWRDGRGMMLEASANREFLARLEEGRLPWRPVARFEYVPWISRELITSLAPAITVYGRLDDGQG